MKNKIKIMAGVVAITCIFWLSAGCKRTVAYEPCTVIVEIECQHGIKYERSLSAPGEIGMVGGACGCALQVSYR